MRTFTIYSAVSLIAAITLCYLPSSSDAQLSRRRDDDSMFDFVKTKIDQTTIRIKNRWRVGGRPRPPPGKKPKVVSTGPNNKYLSAQMQVAKAMAAARGMRRTYSDALIKQTALAATRAKRIPEALAALGVGLFNDYKRDLDCKKLVGCPSSSSIVEQLRAVLGDEGFNDLMSIDGDVSLVFVIDTTYSMSKEIKAAKQIIHEIATYQREGSVDYILSPFNDPTTGPVSKTSIISTFLTDVKGLVAHDGGDCKEKTFHGIIDAIEKGKPRIGSPIFVFTDAGPKDEDYDGQYNKEEAVGLAQDYMLPVNFFFSTNPNGCQKPQTFESFRSMIEETEGVGVLFGVNSKISQMGDLVTAALDGITTIKSGGTARHHVSSARRRLTSFPRRTKAAISTGKRYAIPVDNTVDKLIVVMTVQHSPRLVQLRNPRGIAIAPTHSLSLGAIWIVNTPFKGAWTLVVPNVVGSHSFKVTSSSLANIDFDHYFVWTLPRTINEIPISHPLKNGKPATVKLLIPLKHKLNVNSLRLTLIRTDDGTPIKRASLSGITATFIPPTIPFKLQLSGSTSRGLPFERVSRKVITAEETIIRMVYNRNYLTLPRGRRTTVRFAIHNAGLAAFFDYKLSTSVAGMQLTQPRTSRHMVASNSRRYFIAKITVNRNVRVGTLVPVIVTATKRSTRKVVARLRVHYMVRT